jgi:hypothetical protein
MKVGEKLRSVLAIMLAVMIAVVSVPIIETRAASSDEYETVETAAGADATSGAGEEPAAAAELDGDAAADEEAEPEALEAGGETKTEGGSETEGESESDNVKNVSLNVTLNNFNGDITDSGIRVVYIAENEEETEGADTENKADAESNADTEGEATDNTTLEPQTDGDSISYELEKGCHYQVIVPIEANVTYKVSDVQINGCEDVTVSEDTIGDKECYVYDIPAADDKLNLTVSYQIITVKCSVSIEGKGTVSITEEVNSNRTQTVDKNANLEIGKGQSVTVSIVPDNDYYVSGIKVNGTELTLDSENLELSEENNSMTYTMENVTEDAVIYVKFSSIKTVNVDAMSEMPVEIKTTGHYTVDTSETSWFHHVTTTYYFNGKSGSAVVSVAANGQTANWQQYLSPSGYYTEAYTIQNTCEIDKVVMRRTTGEFAGSVEKYVTKQGDTWRFDLDKQNPEMNVDSTTLWRPEDATSIDSIQITGTASDSNSGIDKIVCFDEEQTDINTILAGSNQAEYKNGTFAITFDSENMPEDGTVCYIYAIDKACNYTEAAVTCEVDKTGPTVSVIENEDVTQWWEKYFTQKKTISVTLGAQDEQSGAKSITIFVDGEKKKTENVKNGTATFQISLKSKQEHTITAIATDYVNNETEEPLEIAKVICDDENPEITADFSENIVKINGIEYTNADMRMSIQVKDEDSGLGAVSIEINGKSITEDLNGKSIGEAYPHKTEATYEDTFEIGTESAIEKPKNGSYSICVTVMDIVGNSAVTTYYIQVDDEAPVIDEKNCFVEGNNADGAKITNEAGSIFDAEDVYGCYAATELKLTVGANDGENGSGVKSITYRMEDADGTVSKEQTIEYAISEDKPSESSEATAADANTRETGVTAPITFPADFKGVIYVKVEDYVGNESTYQKSFGFIEETKTKFDETAHIDINAPTPVAHDKAGNNLYAQDVELPITVTGSYAGIRSIEWTVEGSQDAGANQSGQVEIEQNGTITGGVFQATKKDKNLVTEAAGVLTVSNNSNDIRVTVKMTDRVGYTTEQSIVLSIDKTLPEITITFDSDTGDSVYTDYYKQDRVATVTIKERNFDEKGVSLEITNTDGSVPEISGWSESGSGDDTTYTGTINFDTDGDYTVKLGFTDLAGNAAQEIETKKFTIDKTEPEIKITFDREQGTNGSYFAETRTATVTVTEHNFAKERVTVTGTATLDGISTVFPSNGGWEDAGDEHSTKITFDQDGVYAFEISGLDMAGNEAKTVKADEFCIDKTEPLIEIEGIENMSANNDVVQPVIYFSDTNFDRNNVEIKLYSANHGETKLDGTYVFTENGETFSFQDFAREQSVDDIYTLTASETDLAGNTVTESIMFSVNRFGSVYTLDSSLQKIAGTYIKEPIDVVITETNVDDLQEDSIQIVLTDNGVPQTLVKGTDYTVSRTGNEGSWKQYAYRIKKDMFKGDGTYTVSIYSVDQAGNVNQSIDETKKAEVSFGIDSTAPVIVPVNIEDGGNYNTNDLKASVSVQDNLVLQEVQIAVNGENVEYENQNDAYTFDIPESTGKQSVVVTAKDAAGNAVTYEADNMLISTNQFVRWYNNKPLFVVTVAGITAAVAGAGTIIGFRRKNIIRVKRK